jgi:Predicted glutamine amidotransferases
MTTVVTTMRSIRDPATGELRDSLSRDWAAYLDELEFTALPFVNAVADPAEKLRTLSPDALLLTNGEDVGEHPPRDRTEEALVEAAIGAGIPVLGVCRGHQFLNAYFGGNIINVAESFPEANSHAGTRHSVNIHQGPTQLPLPGTLTVNSYHDMGVVPETVAPELAPYATTDVGRLVEGLYHPEELVLSIQWHPERSLEDREPVDRLVKRFLEGEITW